MKKRGNNKNEKRHDVLEIGQRVTRRVEPTVKKKQWRVKGREKTPWGNKSTRGSVKNHRTLLGGKKSTRTSRESKID